jgi:hypothetical protein
LPMGCTPSDEIAGVAIPNALPNTYLSGRHPTLSDPKYVMEFFWHGSDPDGNVIGYQWKLSNNGTDGIDVQDTLTVDPATGDTIHPWLYTVATDTVIYVKADLPGYPDDQDLDIRDQRAFQTHTIFVRAVDEEGGVDPSPAFLSFTATTFVPSINVDRPARLSGYRDAQAVPPTVSLGFTGSDPDFDLGEPVAYRFIWKRAWIENPPHYVSTRYEMSGIMDDLVSFADSAWSEWYPYPSRPEDRFLRFPNQPARDEAGHLIYYVFAIQAQDTAGAVSVDRVYARNVQNVFIHPGMTPLLTAYETYLGVTDATGLHSRIIVDIAQGQVLQFSWVASASQYAGEVESYRYGWDLVDPDDENDPNWAVLPGNVGQHRSAPAISFGTGTHTLTIQAWDNSDQMTRLTYVLNVVPVPDPSAQRSLLLVDDVKDQASNAWTAQDGVTALDRDRYRDAFWEAVLNGAGGVEGFNPAQDVFDTEDETFGYRDIVDYRVLLWTSRLAQSNFIGTSFKPLANGRSQFVWLNSYQEAVGNVFLAGSRILNQFIEEKRWMIPWFFDTTELTYQDSDYGTFFIGFGTQLLPDGSRLLIGRDRYPYKALGISTLDHVSPKYDIFAVGGLSVSQRRASACAGVKGLILDSDFKARYMPEGGVFSDTILTEATIDWEDENPAYRNALRAWVWGDTEFYDANVTPRTTVWAPQACLDGPCVDPMFHTYSRYDWVDDINAAAGDPAWPAGSIDSGTLLALDAVTRRTVTGGKTCGFISHKLDSFKPSGKGDVVWGFDPYRFDHPNITNAIQWILGDHFGLVMRHR